MNLKTILIYSNYKPFPYIYKSMDPCQILCKAFLILLHFAIFFLADRILKYLGPDVLNSLK